MKEWLVLDQYRIVLGYIKATRIESAWKIANERYGERAQFVIPS